MPSRSSTSQLRPFPKFAEAEGFGLPFFKGRRMTVVLMMIRRAGTVVCKFSYSFPIAQWLTICLTCRRSHVQSPPGPDKDFQTKANEPLPVGVDRPAPDGLSQYKAASYVHVFLFFLGEL